ncbi:ATP-grasp enzyme [Escherichia phage vB_EcoP_IMEP8]|uniref:ATP-grasp enzyme n=1 Tax=Escherichia phage vB_EcoP_IMEP8 TaxID=2866663 RepID=A0AAE8Y7T9_9CAUD|nr:ATP-grasp enzyme [Escherichia phage vB_EcoP_IMEP8]UCR92000.1 ATP-grasp enzyme [Escherichia phage vB_EcoP_IMEP8]
MTTRIRVLPYGPSDSVRELTSAINTKIQELRLNANVMSLVSEGSRYRSRVGDIVVNYGNRRYNDSFFGGATVLNSVVALNRAANKVAAFNALRLAEVKTVEYTFDREVAQNWNQNEIVYERATLTGHSGEGITVRLPTEGVADAPLYTKGIQGPRREWRVHVFEGVITYVQKKIRRNGYRDLSTYREDIRNHHTGWVYSSNFQDAPPDQVLIQAHKAVSALGLNFGAVDLISKNTNAWVLEVNTAPGLTGTTLETYTHNIVEFVKSFSGVEPDYRVAYELPVEEVEETFSPAGDEDYALSAESPEPVVEESSEPVPETMQVEEQGLEITPITRRNLRRGYYIANIKHPENGSTVASNVIVFFCGRNFYRSGWNAPISDRQLGRVLQINSLTLNDGTVVNY